MSTLEFARMTPVTPPTLNKKRKPRVQSAVGLANTREPKREASHLKIFTPVGTAMIIVALVK